MMHIMRSLQPQRTEPREAKRNPLRSTLEPLKGWTGLAFLAALQKRTPAQTFVGLVTGGLIHFIAIQWENIFHPHLHDPTRI